MGRIKYVGIEKLGVIAENTDPDMAAAAAKAAGSPSKPDNAPKKK